METMHKFENGKITDRYDVILDCVGNRTYLTLHRLLQPGGIHITIRVAMGK